MTSRTLRVDLLARVEGEGGLSVRVRDGAVTDVKLKIFEPPRFFEALLRGRDHREAPDITARICGICPVAYQMSAVHAMEDAFGVTVDGPLRALRRLIYCGEWIESHALHVYLLHAPDFLGYPDAIRMAKDHPAVVQRGLRLKKAGNALIRLLGGREVHPINVRVGGFYRTPAKAALQELADELAWARDAAREAVRWAASLPCPELEQPYLFVALRHPDEYPFNEGRLVSSGGLDIGVREYDGHFTEEHVGYSNALHAVLDGGQAYCVGPLARYALNGDRLSPVAREAARDAGLGPVCRNPFRSIVVRSVEILQACDEAVRLIERYERPEPPAVAVPVRPGIGYACTEAPRGILYHRYRIDEQGTILDAKIVPPTSQNQKTIENDLRQFVPGHLDLPAGELRRRCEQIVRNYDPCLSCSTHLLTLELDRA
ncbi:MAG TPA: Ni/Fe hydrogenase subunit alpha [Vicinamibacterales bacterium]|nr:Ni/Fe hydrogenase subunit alpha [Vicinamibacterales bacterium]